MEIAGGAGPPEGLPTEREVEEFLRERIFPDLERGRPEQDKPHTEAAVIKLKEILDHESHRQLDKAVLLVAVYAHDWGYAGLFEGGRSIQRDEMKEAKLAHMELGANKLQVFLEDEFFSYLTDEQKERAVYLVRIHDLASEWVDDDVKVLMEADSLAALDVDLVEPTFNSESNERWIERVVKPIRIPAFLTDYSKGEVERLMEKRREYFDKKFSGS